VTEPALVEEGKGNAGGLAGTGRRLKDGVGPCRQRSGQVGQDRVDGKGGKPGFCHWGGLVGKG
jgi:hypothetical protein